MRQAGVAEKLREAARALQREATAQEEVHDAEGRAMKVEAHVANAGAAEHRRPEPACSQQFQMSLRLFKLVVDPRLQRRQQQREVWARQAQGHGAAGRQPAKDVPVDRSGLPRQGRHAWVDEGKRKARQRWPERKRLRQ